MDEFENTFLSFIVSCNEVVAASVEQCFVARIIEMPRGSEHRISSFFVQGNLATALGLLTSLHLIAILHVVFRHESSNCFPVRLGAARHLRRSRSVLPDLGKTRGSDAGTDRTRQVLELPPALVPLTP